MQQKNYRLLRFIQFVLGLVGWLCVIASPLVLFGLPFLGIMASPDAGTFLVTGGTALGVALSLLTLGLTYLVAAQGIEVVVDIAANTQRTAYLLEHMISHWPATSPAPLTNPMPTITIAETPH